MKTFLLLTMLLQPVLPLSESSWNQADPLSGTALSARTIDGSRIQPVIHGSCTDCFLAQIRNGSRFLYYTGTYQEAKNSLSQITGIYCDMKNPVHFFHGQDFRGTYLEIADYDWSRLQTSLSTADQNWKLYYADVQQACTSLDTSVSDADLVQQIHRYVCDRFSYEVTDASFFHFIQSNTGQCWHYAYYFAAMCQAMGLEAQEKQNSSHAWAEVKVDGICYTFDPTYCDTGQTERYAWQNPIRIQTGEHIYGWLRHGSSWSCYKNSQKLFSTFIWDQGTYYYLNADGNMITNQWVCIDGDWYFTRKDGSLARNTWIKTNGRWYYIGSQWTMLKNQWISDQGVWYWLQADGSMA